MSDYGMFSANPKAGMNHFNPEEEARTNAARTALPHFFKKAGEFALEEATDPLTYLPGSFATKGAKWLGKGLLGAAGVQRATEADATIFGLDKVPEAVMKLAMKLKADGKTEAQIFKQTGVDLKSQKYYVPDNKAKLVADSFRLTQRAEPLSRYFANDPVMQLMPELRRLRIRVLPYLQGNANAAFDPYLDMVYISPELLSRPKQMLSSIIHEVQHGVQAKQGRISGDNPDRILQLLMQKNKLDPKTMTDAQKAQWENTAYEIYRRNLGEQEARFSQKLHRQDLKDVPESHFSSIDDLLQKETMYDDSLVSPFYSDLFK